MVALLNRKGLADMLGVTPEHLDRMRKQGKPLPPSVTVGCRQRWRVASVETWIAAQEKGDAMMTGK